MTEIYTSVLVSGTRRLLAGASSSVDKAYSKEDVKEKNSEARIPEKSPLPSEQEMVTDGPAKQPSSSQLQEDLLEAQEKTISALKETIKKEENSRHELALELEQIKQKLVAFEAKEKNYGSHESMAAAMDGLLADTRRSQQEFIDAAEVYSTWSREKALEIDQATRQLTLICLRKLVGEELGSQRHSLDIITKVVADLGIKEQIVLRVAPRDFSLVEKCKDQLVDALELSGLTVIADAKVQLGGCFIDTAKGSWDGRLETQLARLGQVLLDSDGQEAAEPWDDEVSGAS